MSKTRVIPIRQENKINRAWGKKLSAWLDRPPAFSVLEKQDKNDLDLDSWTFGGCRLLAIALAEILPGRFAAYRFRKLAVYNDKIPQHVAVSAFNLKTRREYIVDGTGSTTRSLFIKRFRDSSYAPIQHQNLNLQYGDYKTEELEKHEITCPAVKLQKLVRLMRTDRSGLFFERVDQ